VFETRISVLRVLPLCAGAASAASAVAGAGAGAGADAASSVAAGEKSQPKANTRAPVATHLPAPASEDVSNDKQNDFGDRELFARFSSRSVRSRAHALVKCAVQAIVYRVEFICKASGCLVAGAGKC
jgi:hypothetical protein